MADEYVILHSGANSPDEASRLIEWKVNEKIEAGWEPTGGPSLAVEEKFQSNAPFFYVIQAMTRKK